MNRPLSGPASASTARGGKVCPARRGRFRRRAEGAILLLLLAALSGCGPRVAQLSRPAPESLPVESPLRVHTLALGDAWVRHHLVFGEPDRALDLLQKARGDASDRLLTSLQQALVLRQSGAYDRSNALLEWAEQEIDRRRVRSVSRTAGSFVVNDRVLSYMPGPSEVALIPFYRMMNFVSMGDAEGAAVEARRVSAAVAGGASAESCAGVGVLQYLSGVVFEAAGELNDALVSLRQAEASFDACRTRSGPSPPAGLGGDLYRVASRLGIEEVADSAASRYAHVAKEPDDAGGELILLLERGFVAHRAEEVIHVPLFDSDIEGLEGGDIDGIFGAAASISTRLLSRFAERSHWGHAWDDDPAVRFSQILDGAHILRLSWPVHPEDRAREPVRSLRVHGLGQELATVGDISSLVRTDLEREREEVLTRMVARGVARYLLTREMEKKAEKQGGEALGFLAGRLANIAANEMERADTRTWTLLPDQISIARIRLPAGTHAIRLEGVSTSGEPSGVIDLGEMDVAEGSVQILTRRIWSEAPDSWRRDTEPAAPGGEASADRGDGIGEP